MGVVNSLPTIGTLKNRSADYDYVVHCGDISYADDYESSMYYLIWQQWFENMEQILSTKYYMTCPGNHESDCGHKGCHDETDHFKAYINRFPLPMSTYKGATPMWYSFNRQMVSWIMVSSETDYPNAFFPAKFGDQLTWLETTLKAAVAARKTRPFIFVVMHRPIYCADTAYSKCDSSHSHCWPVGQSRTVQDAFGALYDKYDVDVVFTGHVHSYNRNYAVKNNGTYVSKATLSPGAPVHITVGTGGNEEGISGNYAPAVPWSAKTFNGNGFGLAKLLEDDKNAKHVFQWQ